MKRSLTRKTKKGINRLIAALLSLGLLMLQTVAFADDIAPNSTAESEAIIAATEQTETASEETDLYDLSIVEEDESLRGEYEKHFLTEDGSYVAISYGTPVHYEDEDGAWQEIDNTLEEKTVDGKTEYTNKDGLFDVTFSEDGEKLVTIEKDGYTVSWDVTAKKDANIIAESIIDNILPQPEVSQIATASVNGAVAVDRQALVTQTVERYQLQDEEFELNSKEPQITMKDTTQWSKTEKLINLIKPSSELTFKQAFDEEIDLEYVVTPTEVKENIILENQSEITSYITTLYAENLTAALKENKSIELLNSENDIIFTIAAPYMYDSANAESYDFDVTLEAGEAGEYIVTYSPSMEWLLSNERVYPVTVDPTINDTSESNYADTYIHEGDTADAHSSETKMYVGIKDSVVNRAYIRVKNLPSISAGAYINSASFMITHPSSTVTSRLFNIEWITSSWSTNSICWNNRPSSVSLQSGVQRNTSTNITTFSNNSLRQYLTAYYAGLSSFYGFVIRFQDESKTNPDYNSIYSSNYSISSCRPLLKIQYTNQAVFLNDYYYIRNANSGKYLDLNMSTNNVTQYNYHGAYNQQWKLVRHSSGYYTIHPVCNDSLYLNVDGASNNNNANISAQTSTGYTSQYWTILRNGTGSYRILSGISYFEKAMVTQNASTSSGANVIQYQYNGTGNSNDDWIITTYKVTESDNSSQNNDYDRTAAVNYARKYAIDGNPLFKILNADCTNFVSQCLYEGGLSTEHINNDTTSYYNWYHSWSDMPEGWSVANVFAKHWGTLDGVGNQRAFRTIEFININTILDNWNIFLSYIHPGDVLQYVGNDGVNKDTAWHSVIITGKNGTEVTCCQHTGNTLDFDLYDKLESLANTDYRILIHVIKASS